jgi:DNA-binding NtrC family response regulator
VLLVEDEDPLRAVIRELLQEGGYTVIDGASPEAALAAADSYGGPIHLVLSDLVMPHMNGMEAVAKVQARRPEVKVLFMSGYTNAAAHNHTSLPVDVAFIQKPFSLDALLRKLREVFDSPAPLGKETAS